jgi:hypothetical protein
MALSVLAYNLTRVTNIVKIKPLIAAIVTRDTLGSWLPEPTSLEAVFTQDPLRTLSRDASVMTCCMRQIVWLSLSISPERSQS